jgi:hypothetical protein
MELGDIVKLPFVIERISQESKDEKKFWLSIKWVDNQKIVIPGIKMEDLEKLINSKHNCKDSTFVLWFIFFIILIIILYLSVTLFGLLP